MSYEGKTFKHRAWHLEVKKQVGDSDNLETTTRNRHDVDVAAVFIPGFTDCLADAHSELLQLRCDGDKTFKSYLFLLCNDVVLNDFLQ